MEMDSLRSTKMLLLNMVRKMFGFSLLYDPEVQKVSLSLLTLFCTSPSRLCVVSILLFLALPVPLFRRLLDPIN